MIENRKRVSGKLIAAVAAVTGMIGTHAIAATGTWSPAAAMPFHWSDATNWTENVVPASSQDTALIFANAGGYNTVNDLPGSFLLNSITIPSGSGNPTFGGIIGGTSDNPLTFVANSSGMDPVFQVGSSANLRTDMTVNGNLTINIPTSRTNLNYISGDLTGTGTVTVNGGGRMDINNSNDFAGTFVVNNRDVNSSPDPSYGVSLAYDGGSSPTIGLPNASNIVVNAGGALFIGTGSSASYVPNYLPDTGTLKLNGGIFYDRGQSLSADLGIPDETETVGAVTFAAGFSFYIAGTATNAAHTILTSSITRTAGAVGGIVGNPGAAALGTGQNQLISTSAIATVGGTGMSTATQSIVPWLIGSSGSSASNLTNFASFVTYDGASAGSGGTGGTGFRVIPESDDAASYTDGADPTHNNVNNNFTAITSDTTINAFRVVGGSSGHLATGSPATLTITSGLLIFSGDGGNIGTDTSAAETGTISFGTAEGIIFVAGQNNGDGAKYDLRVPIAGSGGLTVGANGANAGISTSNTESLVLSTTELYTGNTTVASGILTLGGNAAGGAFSTTGIGSILSTNVTAAQGATLNINAGSTIPTTAVLTANGTVNANDTTLPIATLNGSGTVAAGAVSLSAGGNFSGVFRDGASTGSLTLGGGTLVLSGANTYSGNTTVSAGTLTLAPAGKIASANVSTAQGAAAHLNGLLTGVPNVTANGTAGVGSVITVGASTLAINPSGSVLPRTWNTLTVGSGSAVSLDSAASHATRTVLVASALTFSDPASGTLDLSNNDLIVHNANLGTVSTPGSIASQLKAGFNAGGTYWKGSSGIVSSAAAADTSYLTTLGYRVSDGTSFDNLTTSANTDAEIKYTYYGDANLDGKVDGADYQQIDMGFGSGATGWQNGDFNYDGVVNGSDYALIDNTFNQITAISASPLAVVSSATVSAVPEPTTLALLTLGTIGLLGRRQRKWFR